MLLLRLLVCVFACCVVRLLYDVVYVMCVLLLCVLVCVYGFVLCLLCGVVVCRFVSFCYVWFVCALLCMFAVGGVHAVCACAVVC